MYKQLMEARKMATMKIEHFIGLCQLNGHERVCAWENLSTSPYMKHGKWHSVYRNAKSQGMFKFDYSLSSHLIINLSSSQSGGSVDKTSCSGRGFSYHFNYHPGCKVCE
jgi:hypothetical protein